MKNENKNSSTSNGSAPFPIVAIGASAGGIHALKRFFKSIPNDCGMAFVVIQHLNPEMVSIMPQLIEKMTTMGVTHASDGLVVKPNMVYVLPPRFFIIIINNTLYLREMFFTKGLRLPIDFFFESLANTKKSKSIVIILSGMGSDGSQGVKAIKAKKGLVLVQDPLDAEFNSMPESAIQAVKPDVVASADELGKRLLVGI